MGETKPPGPRPGTAGKKAAKKKAKPAKVYVRKKK